jgi:hypothetical protein
MMTIRTTPQQQAEIEAHWAQVRAGIYKSAPHVFADRPTGRIDALRARAWISLTSACADMREAEDLAKQEDAA